MCWLAVAAVSIGVALGASVKNVNGSAVGARGTGSEVALGNLREGYGKEG
jgi:hypothetical protein